MAQLVIQPLPVTVRTALDADLPAVAAIHIASWRATYVNELSPEYLARMRLEDRVALWRRRLAEGARLLVAASEHRLVGFVASGPSRDADDPAGVWEIWNLHLVPEWKGAGVGSRLFDAAARQGRDEGARQLTLWVVSTNERARRFYTHKGMSPDGAEKVVALGDERMHEVRYRCAM